MSEDPAAVALAYHQRTRHGPHAYARALPYLDWDSQPDPFRRYLGAPLTLLDREPGGPDPLYDAILDGERPPPVPFTWESVSRLYADSLALSAWKAAGDTRWPLRVNPSSGNLHPTEAYLVCGPVPELGDTSAVYHYNAYFHALERRASLPEGRLPHDTVFVGLTSIAWRESWKYGERAFRYCQHDLGHAIAAVAIAAAALGWRARLLEAVLDDELAALLGIATQDRIEAEFPECLIAVSPGPVDDRLPLPSPAPTEWAGTPARLSEDHHDWPILDVVTDATRKRSRPPPDAWHAVPPRADSGLRRPLPLRRIVAQRRSAVAMDGRTSMRREDFLRTMRRLLPGAPPFDALPWRPCVHPFLFVHRVEGLEPGLYALLRDPGASVPVSRDFAWEPVEPGLPLFLLRRGEVRRLAQSVSCGQAIAADGAFALGMLADLEGGLRAFGAPFYRRLHWEAGAIGQVLYLEAESDGLRGTGIGCFFDDSMHEALGLARDSGWKTLYHFTTGGPVEDDRLRTLAPYAHLG